MSSMGSKLEEPPNYPILLRGSGRIHAFGFVGGRSEKRRKWSILDGVRFIRNFGGFGRPAILDSI